METWALLQGMAVNRALLIWQQNLWIHNCTVNNIFFFVSFIYLQLTDTIESSKKNKCSKSNTMRQNLKLNIYATEKNHNRKNPEHHIRQWWQSIILQKQVCNPEKIFQHTLIAKSCGSIYFKMDNTKHMMFFYLCSTSQEDYKRIVLLSWMHLKVLQQ